MSSKDLARRVVALDVFEWIEGMSDADGNMFVSGDADGLAWFDGPTAGGAFVEYPKEINLDAPGTWGGLWELLKRACTWVNLQRIDDDCYDVDFWPHNSDYSMHETSETEGEALAKALLAASGETP